MKRHLPAILLVLLSACALVESQTKKAAAEDAYTKAQKACASTEPTRAAVDACRARVRAEWEVDGGR